MKISRVSIAFLLLFGAFGISFLTEWDQMGPPSSYVEATTVDVGYEITEYVDLEKEEESGTYKPCVFQAELFGEEPSRKQHLQIMKRKKGVGLTTNALDNKE